MHKAIMRALHLKSTCNLWNSFQNSLNLSAIKKYWEHVCFKHVGDVIQAKMSKTRPSHLETCNWRGVIKEKREKRENTEIGGKIWTMPWMYKMWWAKFGEMKSGFKTPCSGVKGWWSSWRLRPTKAPKRHFLCCSNWKRLAKRADS